MRLSEKTPRRRSKRRFGPFVALICVLFALYGIVGGYAPFAVCPRPGDEADLEARVEAMSRDIETADRAMILYDSDQALDERLRLMNLARREIIIATYDCRDGESTRDLLCVALERAEAGVSVRILVDGISGRVFLTANPLFRALESHENVEIRLYNPPKLFMPWHHMGRMHDKYLIVDDLGYILGGRNMFDSFIGSYDVRVRKDDREAFIVNGAHGTDASGDSSLFQLRDYFEGIWSGGAACGFSGPGIGEGRIGRAYDLLRSRYAALTREKPSLFAGGSLEDGTVPVRGIWLISNPTGIYAKQPEAFSLLCALMARAKRGVIIHSPYAVLNQAMRERLSSIAGSVPLELMINAVENSDNVVASSDYLYHRDEVLSTGVRLWEYSGENYHHGKAVVIDDDISIIGSYNLDLRSTYVDTELMLVIRGREINAALRADMDALRESCAAAAESEGSWKARLPIWKRVPLRVLGVLIQPFRNLV